MTISLRPYQSWNPFCTPYIARSLAETYDNNKPNYICADHARNRAVCAKANTYNRERAERLGGKTFPVYVYSSLLECAMFFPDAGRV